MILLRTAAALGALVAAMPAHAQHQGHDMGGMPMPAPTPAPSPVPAPHQGHGTPAAPASPHAGHAMPAGEGEANEIVVNPQVGPTMGRDGPGTSWRPDSSEDPRGEMALHAMRGDWMFMGHVLLNGVHDWQQGPRGGEKSFVSGMIMGMARGELGTNDRIELRAMLSPEPLIGRRGYPLLFAAGETADGATLLVDRQHPHDFFMELSTRYTHIFGTSGVGAFVYAGLPGEPAFGPPAFMHRMSIMDSPEAPITHHWLDSTHISFGVITAGLATRDVKFEASRFNGREPDQRRWNIETGPLDSTAIRLSWNPTYNLALQASWAHLVAPEQLEPDENSTRWSASAIWTRRFGRARWISTTFAWGNRDGADAVAVEAAAGLGLWTLYGRAEYAENDELDPAAGHHGSRRAVSRMSLGAIRDFRVARGVRLGLGAQVTQNFVPAALEPFYTGDPRGAMAFVRLKLD